MIVLVPIALWLLWVWFLVRGPACFFCGRRLPSKCGCPGMKR